MLLRINNLLINTDQVVFARYWDYSQRGPEPPPGSDRLISVGTGEELIRLNLVMTRGSASEPAGEVVFHGLQARDVWEALCGLARAV